MLGFAAGGVITGKLADRFGITTAIIVSALALGLGYVAVGNAASLWQAAIAHGVLIGAGTSATFAPLMADISHWFRRRRGIAVTIAAAGNYLAGTIWPPVVQHFTAADGWRATYIGIGVFCMVTMIPLSLLLRRANRRAPCRRRHRRGGQAPAALPLSPNALLILLFCAGICCCVAMSMPQVHIVAYCSDLGYGVARGADMLSLMLGLGIVSRIGSGFIADRIGGVRTLIIGSVMQGVALLLYLFFDSMFSLYVISGAVRPVPGRHRADVRHHRARIFPGQGSRLALGFVIMGTIARHGAGRLDVGRDLRSHRLLPSRLPQRTRLEPAQRLDRRVPAAAFARPAVRRANGLKSPPMKSRGGVLPRRD